MISNRMEEVLEYANKSNPVYGETGGIGRGLPDMEDELDGSKIKGAICCCVAVDATAAVKGVAGEDVFIEMGQAAHKEYRCRDREIGDCKYRVCSEPTRECIYKAVIRNGASDRLVAECQRIDAHDEADIIYEQEKIKAKALW